MKKQLTMSSLGSNGRLGNQLFQYASLTGLSIKFNAELKLPAWPYAQYFEHQFPQGEPTGAKVIEVKEPTFKYIPDWPYIRENECVDVWGFLQSKRYWDECEDYVRRMFTFKTDFVDQCLSRFDQEDRKNAIAISIRRGDFVGNVNYQQLPIASYFILALMTNFPDWRTRNIIVFSDDIPYCRVHFSTLNNVTFSEGNSDIEDICLMSQCSDFIISNSTFSWWGAYLSNNPNKKVIRPMKNFAGPLAKKNDESDYYPPEWTVFNHETKPWYHKKIDLKDVTFTIPVSYDHEDRKQNLELCIKMLKKDFECDIVVCEQINIGQSPKFEYLLRSHGIRGYIPYYASKFHRTFMLNMMARDYTKNPYVFNWDADVIIPPLQLWDAVDKLRNGADMVFPYKWAFARIPRGPWFTKLQCYEDIGLVGDTRFNGMNSNDVVSLGGAVGFRRQSFIEGGMENENFISYGPEDVEREHRFSKLGFRIERTLGPNLYHINHYVGPNSCPRHPYFKGNEEEWSKVKRMSKEELRGYIDFWTWAWDKKETV